MTRPIVLTWTTAAMIDHFTMVTRVSLGTLAFSMVIYTLTCSIIAVKVMTEIRNITIGSFKSSLTMTRKSIVKTTTVSVI